MVPRAPTFTLFPYTTLFRSARERKWVLGLLAVAVTLRVLLLVGLFATSNHDEVTSFLDRKSTRLNSSHVSISYAVFCLKKKKRIPSVHCLFIYFRSPVTLSA